MRTLRSEAVGTAASSATSTNGPGYAPSPSASSGAATEPMPNMALTRLDGPAPRVANAALKPPESAPKPRPVSKAAVSISGQPTPSSPAAMGVPTASTPSAKAALPIMTEVRSAKRVSSAASSSGPNALPKKWALLIPATVAVLTPNLASKLGKAGP